MIKHMIKSPNNATIKYVKQLKTKKNREKNKQYLVDGLRIVKHALEHHHVIDYLIITEAYEASSQLKSMEKLLENTKVYVVDAKLMKDLAETESPQGIMAVVHKKEMEKAFGSILVLDRVQDPGNIGTLIRTADAAGFKTVILAKGCTDPYSQKALRSSMGSIMTLNIIHSDVIGEDLNKLKAQGYEVYSAALEDGVNFKSIDYTEKKILVIGNEANGISQEILKLSNNKIYIPMIGQVESLNASIAGGILMFEMNK